MSNETMHASTVTPVLFPSDKERFIMLYNIGRLNRYYALLLAQGNVTPEEVVTMLADMTTASYLQVALATAGGVCEAEIRWLIKALETKSLDSRDMVDVLMSIGYDEFGKQ